MADFDWKGLLTSLPPASGTSVRAVTFIKKWPTYSQPVALECDDGGIYVVKALQRTRDMSKSLFNERVIGLLGTMMTAPIPRLLVVDVPQELIDAEVEMQHILSGPAHGSEQIPNCSERLGIEPPGSDRNRQMYALLCVLYGWIPANDHQLVATLDTERQIFSVDHGHFFPGGPDWTPAALGAASSPTPDPQFALHVSTAELANAAEKLHEVDNASIGAAIGAVPSAWGVPLEERVTVARYLAARRDTMVSLLEES